ncbi:MAG: MoaD/ThiS family protein [Halobacteriaceae archaeon]
MEFVVYGPLRAATGGKTVELAASPETVGAAIEALVAAHPRARRHLYDGDGQVRPSVRVQRDGERLALDDAVDGDETLTLLPAMRGG